jgi:hypothetical protein
MPMITIDVIEPLRNHEYTAYLQRCDGCACDGPERGTRNIALGAVIGLGWVNVQHDDGTPGKWLCPDCQPTKES